MSTSKHKVVTKVREKLILSPEDKAEWAKMYDVSKKLPNINIPCNVCSMGITCGHDNLHSKVAKFGGILNLLNNFVCRECRRASEESTGRSTSTVARSERKPRAVSEADPETKRYDLPEVNLNPVRCSYTIEEIAASKELTEEFTDGSCLKPRLYLDNGKTCDNCVLYTNCACTIKQLSKSKRREFVS